MTRILCTLFICLTASICSAADEAETYEDCILDNMKGVTSDVAAQAIKEACTAKFNTTVIPDTENETAEISQAELNASDKIKYCHYVSTDRLFTTELACGTYAKEVSKTEYLRLQSLQAIQNQRQPRSQQTYSQPNTSSQRSSTSNSSNRMSTGEFLQKWGNILQGYSPDATPEEVRRLEREKEEDCARALEMNALRKYNGQAQQALPLGCY